MNELSDSNKKNESSAKKPDKTGTKLNLNNVYSSDNMKELETTRKIKDIIKKGSSREYKPKQTQSNNLFPIQIPEIPEIPGNSIFGNGFSFKDSLNSTKKINYDWRNIDLNRNRLSSNIVSFSPKSKQQPETKTKPVVPQNEKFNSDEDIKNGFNNYVGEAIDNHEKEILFQVKNGNFVVQNTWYPYSQSNAVNLAATKVLKTLWHKFTNQEQKNKNKLTKKSEFVLDIAKSECILNNENKEKLTNLLADSKAKVLEEQKKILEEREKLKKENSINLGNITNKVLNPVKAKVEEKINPKIKDRKKILQDFNNYVSNAIEKHNDKKDILYECRDEKLYLLYSNDSYDTKEELVKGLIGHLATTFATAQNILNPFQPDQFNLNDEIKKKLDDSIDSAILNNLSKELNDFKIVNFPLIGGEFEKKVKGHEFKSIQEIKISVLKQFIQEKYQNKKIFDQITDNQLANVAISSEKLTYILSYSIFNEESDNINRVYYYSDSIDNSNFEQKLQELKDNYDKENISPTVTVCFLMAIKQNDLTSEIFEKVLEHSVTKGGIAFPSSLGEALELIENLQNNCYMPDKFVDIISCFATSNGNDYFSDLRNFLTQSKNKNENKKYKMCREYEAGDENKDVETLYKLIYFIIVRSKNYKQAKDEKTKKTAVQKAFSSDGFCKNLWIVLANLKTFENEAVLSCAEFISTKTIFERAAQNPNGYAKKLSDLLVENDIYISSETAKTKNKDGNNVDQICVKTDSYQKNKKQAQEDFNKYMDQVISNLSSGENVTYDWIDGKLTLAYNKDKKMIYDFQQVNFDDNKDNENNVAEATKQFSTNILKSYAEDKKLAYYEDKNKKSVSYEFDLNISNDHMQKIQQIVGEKRQAKIEELTDEFGFSVIDKIEEHNPRNTEKALFKFTTYKNQSCIVYDEYYYNLSDDNEVQFFLNTITLKLWSEFFKIRFYKAVEIDEATLDEVKGKVQDRLGCDIKEQHININKNIVSNTNNNEKSKDQDLNQNQILNPKDIKKDIKEENTSNSGNEKLQLQNVIKDNTDQSDPHKTKNDGVNEAIDFKSENLNDLDNKDQTNKVKLTGSINDNINLDDNNTRGQITQNKHGSSWIKFLTVLKWIALIGCILAAIIMITASFSAAFPVLAEFMITNLPWIAPIFVSYIKPAIATVVFLFTFGISNFFISSLSDDKKKINKSPYPTRIDTLNNRNENEFDISEISKQKSLISQPTTEQKSNDQLSGYDKET